MILFLLKITDFCPSKISLEQKKLYFTKKIQLGFSSKIEVPSLARLGSETFQLGLAQLGKFQLELITRLAGCQDNIINISSFIFKMFEAKRGFKYALKYLYEGGEAKRNSVPPTYKNFLKDY